MRPIKFRAWLEDKQEMYYQYDNTASAMNGLSRFAEVVGSQVGYTPEVMQFTGLLDKNGREIYESDLLKTMTGHIFKVEWNDAFGAWSLNGLEFMQEQINGGWFPHYKYCEIIGNIYQNPEIIK